MSIKKKCRLCYKTILHVNPYCKECQNIDIQYFGDYRIGLTAKEIEKYLGIRANTMSTKKLYRDFCKISGVNTCGVGPQGQGLMYRYDVQRFSDKLLLGTPTHWD